MTEINISKNERPADDLLSLSIQSKKHLENNPLLEALTLVIESNADYARGVTALLDSDLEREVLLNDIKKDLITIKKLVEKNNVDLIAFQAQLTSVIEKVDKLDTNIESTVGEKLAPLYIAADLQESGAQYNPTDKLVVTIRKVLSSKLFTMLAGVAIWFVAKLLFKGLK
jgi:hypothetical protein